MLALTAIIATGRSPIVIAHRGAPDFAPENTLSSFVIAAVQGADAIECDIWLSSDGKLIVNHDPTTGRVWSEDLEIEKTDSETLTSLSLNHGFCAAFPKYKNEHIPLFRDVFENTEDMHIFAELKSGTPQANKAFLEELERLGAKDRVTVISFSRESVEFFISHGYESAWLVACEEDEVAELDIPKEAILDISANALTEENITLLHERGVTVYAWTAPGEAKYRYLASIGADGVTCDNISFCAK